MPIPELVPTVTVDEAAAILGISRGLAYQGVREGTLPSITIGRRIIVPTLALAALLATPSPTPQRPGAS
jgi:excisionase family DNA binding protein